MAEYQQGKLLIRPPELSGNHTSKSSSSKAEETVERNEFALTKNICSY
jgi:hypothetical protein